MKTFYNLYILIVFTWKESRGRSEEESRHLSRKLNPGCPGLALRTGALEEGEATDCLGRIDARWPDKLPETDQAVQSYKLIGKVSVRQNPTPRPQKERSKREARLPANFLLWIPEPSRPRRRSEYEVRHSAQVKRRKRRKQKRSQPILTKNQIVDESISPRNVSSSDENGINWITAPPYDVSTNAEVPVGESNARDKGYRKKNGESNVETHRVLFTVLVCLVALTVSALLLLYLYKRLYEKPHPDSFCCPREIGLRGDKPPKEEIDRCTCCSSGRSCAERVGRRSSRWSGRRRPPQTVRKKRAEPPQKPREKPSIVRKKSAPKFSEAELQLVRSRIASILRNECTDCQCCKCHASEDLEEPKRRRFRFFRKKRKSGLCDDGRCDERKIRCLMNVCAAALPDHSRNPNSVVFEDDPNPRGRSASKGKKKLGLRMRD